MEWFSTLSLALGSAWTSGINLYATVTVLGLLQKFGATRLPAAFFAGTAHATTARSSMMTVQQPHCPVGLHPSFGERMPHWSRSTSSSVVSSSISAARG